MFFDKIRNKKEAKEAKELFRGRIIRSIELEIRNKRYDNDFNNLNNEAKEANLQSIALHTIIQSFKNYSDTYRGGISNIIQDSLNTFAHHPFSMTQGEKKKFEEYYTIELPKSIDDHIKDRTFNVSDLALIFNDLKITCPIFSRDNKEPKVIWTHKINLRALKDEPVKNWIDSSKYLMSFGLDLDALASIDKALTSNKFSSEAWLLKGEILENIFFLDQAEECKKWGISMKKYE